jgi:hypothetical protein
VLLYTRGDAHALAATVQSLITLQDHDALRSALRTIAGHATIEAMHSSRVQWVRATVLG